MKKMGKMPKIGKETNPSILTEAKADDTAKLMRRRVKTSQKKAQKENNTFVKPNNTFSPYNRRHETERDYLNQMDEKIWCEDNNIHSDKTKLDKLTDILEKLNKEDEDFKEADINEEIMENQEKERTLKEDTYYDSMSTPNKYANEQCQEMSTKCKVPPNNKSPVLFPKNKTIRQQIDFSVT